MTFLALPTSLLQVLPETPLDDDDDSYYFIVAYVLLVLV